LSEKWWLVLDCDEAIGTYYRDLYRLFHYRTRELIRPAWDSHITVIRNEEPTNKEVWEKYAGKQVEFVYESSLQTDGNYWWLTVVSEELLDVRTELGLPRDPQFPLHLSVGHQGLTQ
jgi:hypothetical protein